MSQYRSISVMASDSGKSEPYAIVTLVYGPDSSRPCTAQKRIPLDGLHELEELIDWAAEASGAAFEALFTKDWTVTHHITCADGGTFSHAEA